MGAVSCSRMPAMREVRMVLSAIANPSVTWRHDLRRLISPMVPCDTPYCCASVRSGSCREPDSSAPARRKLAPGTCLATLSPVAPMPVFADSIQGIIALRPQEEMRRRHTGFVVAVVQDAIGLVPVPLIHRDRPVEEQPCRPVGQHRPRAPLHGEDKYPITLVILPPEPFPAARLRIDPDILHEPDLGRQVPDTASSAP